MEPSDEAVRAAVDAFNEVHPLRGDARSHDEAMRAALRAALPMVMRESGLADLAAKAKHLYAVNQTLVRHGRSTGGDVDCDRPGPQDEFSAAVDGITEAQRVLRETFETFAALSGAGEQDREAGSRASRETRARRSAP